MNTVNMIQANSVAEQATGCPSAGSYQDYAEEKGFDYVEVLDWTSSAGDWSFLVSKDKKNWQILSQTNNWPRCGFSYQIGEEVYKGTAEEVLQLISELYY